MSGPYIFKGDNPSQIYLDALRTLLEKGKSYSPRGKEILEIRPAILAYTKPTNRVTFLKGRVINPFFQLAESFWILSGRSDVQWLLDYNQNMRQFSDDGNFFNAPYGERLRFWNKSDANGFIFNPVDQLHDVYKKISDDLDTRQAYSTIYNPTFDNYDNETVDRPCNLGIDFKVRDNKLEIWVPNRSNDLHWGTFGANLAQFSTIQELVASWLGLEIGTYYQNSNSLHIYTEDYGSDITDSVLKAYLGEDRSNMEGLKTEQFEFDTEPRMSSSYNEFSELSALYFQYLDGFVKSAGMDSADFDPNFLISTLGTVVKDDYFRMTFTLMAVYHAHKGGHFDNMMALLDSVPDCSWKVSCLRLLSRHYRDNEYFRASYDHLNTNIVDYINRKGE